MSQAFMKEGEVPDPTCPPSQGCGGSGDAVTKETLRSYLNAEALARLPNGGYFCTTPDCPVVYFDGWGGVVKVAELARPAWPKNASAPICACLSMTEEDVIADAENGIRDRVREIVYRAEDGGGECMTAAASGRSCQLEVRKIFQAHYSP